MNNAVGLLNASVKVEAFRAKGVIADGEAQLLQTDWQSILSELLDSGIPKEKLVNDSIGSISLTDAVVLYFTASERLRNLKAEIRDIMRRAMTYQDKKSQEEAKKVLAYLKRGWKAALTAEKGKARKQQSATAKQEAQQRKADKQLLYRRAKDWLSHHSQESAISSVAEQAYLAFDELRGQLEQATDSLDPSERIEFLEIVQQHTFHLIAEIKKDHKHS
jgi:hypothetical protein